MLRINNDTIYLTKGDSAYFNIQVFTPDGKEYFLRNNDKIVFYFSKFPCETVSKRKMHPPLFTKEFIDKTIRIDPQDTDYIDYGEYYWKCELQYANGRDIDSVCGGRFYLTCEA